MKMQCKLFTQALYGLGLLSLLFLVNGCNENGEEPTPVTTPVINNNVSVQITNNAQLGSILVDNQGRTLYFFTRDAQSNSACENGCLDLWPVFYDANLSAGAELDTSDFGTITRNDGSLQTTYKGWPLYYFAPNGDGVIENPGQTLGENVGEVWYVARPNYQVMIANQEVEGEAKNYLVDAQGRTLYFFSNDADNVSNCEGNCLEAWPAFFTENQSVPSFLNQGDFSSITRNDGQKQITFQGRPLYFFAQDANRGETNGQGINNVWFVAEAKANNAGNPNVPEGGY